MAFGSKDHFTTFGGGVAFESLDNSIAIFTFGYYKRISKGTAFIVDIWVPTADGFVLPLPTIGFRLFLKSDITIDIGFPVVGFKIPLDHP